MAEYIAEMIDVSKIIRKQTIVSKINMKIVPGEIVALCGGNGAGKSTILRMLAGITQPSEGIVRVAGLQTKIDRNHVAYNIGYMPDDYQFGLGLTAREALGFWAKLRGESKQRVAEVLEAVGLTETGNKPVSAFSKGMRQRVLFAQAILARPRLLLMDEPTNGLDPYWMDTFVQLVQSLQEQGSAVIFSTHQIHVAEVLADRLIFLREGRIEMDSTMDEVHNLYGSEGLHHAFAGLLGVRKMDHNG